MGKHNMVNYVVVLLMINAWSQLRYAHFITIANKASEIKAAISKIRFGGIVPNMEHGHTDFVMILECTSMRTR